MTRLLWLAAGESENMRALMAEGISSLRVTVRRSAPEVLLYVRNSLCDVLVISASVPSPQTDDILLEIRRADPSLPVIVDCASAETDDVIRLVRLGAFHVWTGGTSPDNLTSQVERALQRRRETARKRPEPAEEPWRASLVGSSDVMARVTDVIRLVAARRSSILITGETGTGKEVVARAIHTAGGRGHMPFVAVNCSAIPENLVESELFGYVKGAFTGAVQSRAGKFEQADGGTIFLDEVGELPLDVQAKLLRVLQEREVQRLGGSETIQLNVRVIAATNANLEEAVSSRLFREDLYYRLSVVPLRLPPLRERASDIPALVEHFLTRVCQTEGLPLRRVTRAALDHLRSYHWPGNVRQLEHAIEMAVVLSGDRHVLEPSDFAFPGAGNCHPVARRHSVTLPETGLDFTETVNQFERSILQQALERSGGNKARAAQLLRMKRTTLLARMKSLQFDAGSDVLLAEEACA